MDPISSRPPSPPSEAYTDPLLDPQVNPPGDDASVYDLPQTPPKPNATLTSRLFYSAICASCIAIRIINFSNSVNALMHVGTGFAFQAILDTNTKNAQLARIHRITKTIFSQPTNYLFTKLASISANYNIVPLQSFSIATVLILLGANIRASLQSFREINFRLRIESSADTPSPSPFLTPPTKLRTITTIALKTLAIAAFSTASFFIHDPVGRGLATFAATTFSGQLAGWALLTLLHTHIQQDDTTPHGSRTRVVKTLLNTLSFATIPLLIILPGGPELGTLDRIPWFPILGAFTGFCDELIYRSQQTRFTNFPPHKLAELEQIPTTNLHRLAYPLFFGLSLLAIFTFETSYYYTTPLPKVELGAMTLGFATTFFLANLIDHYWQPTKPHLNPLMANLLNTRILGIDPLYYYFAGVYAMTINTDTIDNEDNFCKSASPTIWFSYGLAMALELWRIWGSRRGTPVTTFPRMAIIDSSMTLALALRDEVVA
jgi:hypothetical protein